VLKQAEAERAAAERQAEARLRLAEADAKAKERNAQADQASRMVEVNVERERVNVEQARVEVERQALENKQTFDRAALDFETAKLQIEANKDVRVAMAAAMGEFMSRGNFQVYGDPTTMSQMMGQFSKGLSFGAMVDGLMDGLPEQVKSLAGTVGEAIKPTLAKLGGGNGHPDGAGDTPAAAATEETVSTADGADVVKE
jgi:hypothetical protein